MVSSHSHIAIPGVELCNCQPLSSLHLPLSPDEEECDTCEKQVVPVAASLHEQLRVRLETLLPRSIPLSIFVLHVAQLEHIHLASQSQSASLSKRRRYHAAEGLLEQIMANVRRAIRTYDQLYIKEQVGAVLFFPGVDEQGAYTILERIYHNVSLLQAETVIPPLQRETSILMGIGTYDESTPSLEQFLYHTGQAARCFTLRPAITPQLGKTKAFSMRADVVGDDEDVTKLPMAKIPFMQLPEQLLPRLKQLIPYKLACQLRCVPVGRNHHCLTVAMANPLNSNDIYMLAQQTGMSIFPVSCEEDALDVLLEQEW